MPSALTKVETFNTTIKQAELSVVHFAADWVEQCGQINDLFDALAKHQDYAKVQFYTCDAESLSEVSLENNIEAVPTVILFKNGAAIDRIEGSDTAKITTKIKEHLESSSNRTSSNNKGSAEISEKKLSLEERLKALVNKSPIMLFMKGDRVQPRCGFSRQIIEILNETGVEYETFNILSDEEVRQGLKSYSDWPTYPQLYVKGELLGGLDIIKEMKAGGDLAAALIG